MQSLSFSAPRIHRNLLLNSEFRLVVLLPSADFDSHLECHLEHAIVGACKPYEALSYVWGNPEFTKEITVDDHDYMIMLVLDRVLRHLRLPDRKRVL